MYNRNAHCRLRRPDADREHGSGRRDEAAGGRLSALRNRGLIDVQPASMESQRTGLIRGTPRVVSGAL